MIITENTNLNATLESTDSEGNKKQIVSINSNLTQNSKNFNFSYTIMDEEEVEANLEDIQTQMDEFMVALKAKMVNMGYKVTI